MPGVPIIDATALSAYPESYLYDTLGLYKLPSARRDLPNAKGLMPQVKAGCGKSARPV